jgi:predicted secreted acid phosphatase
MKTTPFVLTLSLLVFSCSPQIQNLSTAKNNVDNYYVSGRYGLELYDIIQEAIVNISSLNLTPSSTVVFDVDETVLSNYEYMKNHDFGWDRESWNRWLIKGKSEIIPQTKKLYDFLIENNISVIFLTARPDIAYEATYDNLKNVGYTMFDTLICKPNYYDKINNGEFKSAERIKLTNMGYSIIASVGDQKSDFIGEYTGLQIKVPNYFYDL